MRNLEYLEFKSAQFQARVFEKSIEEANFSSPMFIRRFMMSGLSKPFIDNSILFTSWDYYDVIDELNEMYKPSTKKPLFSKEEMYWIGFMYAIICILYKMNPKKAYKLFPDNEIRKYYLAYHTFSLEQAAEQMIENINYNPDLTAQGVVIVSKYFYQELLSEQIGKEVEIRIPSDKVTYKIASNEDIFLITNGLLVWNDNIFNREQEVYLFTKDNLNKVIRGNIIGLVIHLKDDKHKPIITTIDEIDKEIIEKEINKLEKSNKIKIVYK